MPDAVRLTLLRTTAELEDFAPAWRALYDTDPHATPFQHPAWLIPWWHHFGQPDLRTVVLTRNGSPVGLLPFYIYPDPHTGERHLLPLGVGTTDYLDGVFSPDCAATDILRALDLFCDDSGWDVLHVPQLRPGSLLLDALSRTPGTQPFTADHCSRMPAAPISGLPSKIRRNAMYYRNRAARLGTLELTFAATPTLSTAFESLVRLHTDRWNQNGQPGVLADPGVLAWHREALPRLHEAGLLRLCTLRLDDEVLAVLYSLVDPPGRPDRTQYFYITAYSTAHADLRPGTLLLALAIDHAANEGIRTIDMLRGDEPYKRIWHLSPAASHGYTLAHPARAAAAA
jgi:CelD/BcsL family acetyltransferase involved in cellulose biosynthesis